MLLSSRFGIKKLSNTNHSRVLDSRGTSYDGVAASAEQLEYYIRQLAGLGHDTPCQIPFRTAEVLAQLSFRIKLSLNKYQMIVVAA